MLQELHVRNLGVLDEALVAFSPGLNVITGETGAGKTLLMTSLALLTGARAEARLVGTGQDAALVEAVLSQNESLTRLLAERGLEACEEVIAQRRVGNDGRSRAWLSGQLVTISALSEVVGSAVQIHGQGAGFRLARAAEQLEAIDTLANSGPLIIEYRAALSELRQAESLRDRLASDDRARIREIEYLSFQVDEIEAAQLTSSTDEQIATELGRLEHAEQLADDGQLAGAMIGSEGAYGSLSEAAKLLQRAAELDASLSPHAQKAADLAIELEDLGHDIRQWSQGLEPDPPRLEAVRQRSALIDNLRRKYGATTAEILESGQLAATQLAQLQAESDRADGLDDEIAALTARTAQLADELSARRAKACKKMTRLVSQELPALALPHAKFEAVCTTTRSFTENGRDHVEFGFSASSQRKLEPIGKVASGGELSRAMIAVTLALATNHDASILVFDEADAGVGGSAALDLGKRLAQLASTNQVLVVSHLPQIAAFADRHLVVSREDGRVAVRAVEAEQRVAEISRMLAGLGSSDLARAHAAELIELGSRPEQALSK